MNGKRKIAVLAAVCALALIASAKVVEADLTGDATAHVYVDVVANIAVGVIDSNVDLGEIQTGDVVGEITFRIDANVEQVKLGVVASNLYKGDVPTGTAGYQIPVSGSGAFVDPNAANPTEGGSKTLPWTTTQVVDADQWLYNSTGLQEYESNQGGHFSQDVDVTVTWNQPDPELPTGEYSGWVKLVAEIDPV